MTFPNLAEFKISINPAYEEKMPALKNELLGIIKKNDTKEIETLASKLAKYPFEVLFRCAQLDSEIENFLRTNKTLSDLLVSKIQTAKSENFAHPAIQIDTMLSNQSFSIFDLYLAVNLETLTLKRESQKVLSISDTDALAYAIKLGLPDAVLIKFKAANLGLSKKSQENKDSSNELEIMLELTKLLTDRYWCYGYLAAGCRLFVIAQHFMHLGEIARGKTYQRMAVKNFLCASLLENDEYSNKLLMNITDNGGIASVLNGFFESHKLNIRYTDSADFKLICENLIGKNEYIVAEYEANAELGNFLRTSSPGLTPSSHGLTGGSRNNSRF